MNWEDVAINIVGMECAGLLEPWNWLIKDKPLTPVAITSFGDWILQADDGGIHFLDTLGGNIQRIAGSRAEYEVLASLEENMADWFMADMVHLLRERGIVLKKGECYGYKISPIIGGKIEVDNISPIMIMVHQVFHGQILEQASKMPPGTKIAKITVDGKDP